MESIPGIPTSETNLKVSCTFFRKQKNLKLDKIDKCTTYLDTCLPNSLGELHCFFFFFVCYLMLDQDLHELMIIGYWKEVDDLLVSVYLPPRGRSH